MSFYPYHKRPALIQTVFKAVSAPCHVGRGLAGYLRCVRVGNGYGKTRLYSPIRSKTTAFPWCARHHSRSATAGTQASQGTTAQAYSNSPPLEEPTVGVGVIPAAETSPI